MIVDADQYNIAFYRKSARNGEPTDKNILTCQYTNIFHGYYLINDRCVDDNRRELVFSPGF